MINSPYDISTKLQKVISDLVGYKLSSLPTTPPRPSVIRSGGYDTDTQAPVNEPKFPYIAVDYINSRRWGDADILNNYMNSANEEVVETDLHLYYDIKCYGLAKDDCGSIMQELSRRLELNSSREAIQQDIEARLFYTDNVRKFTVKRSTNIVEVHRLQIQLAVRDSLVDTLGTVISDITIDTTITDGGLYRYPEDPSPLPLEIQAP